MGEASVRVEASVGGPKEAKGSPTAARAAVFQIYVGGEKNPPHQSPHSEGNPQSWVQSAQGITT